MLNHEGNLAVRGAVPPEDRLSDIRNEMPRCWQASFDLTTSDERQWFVFVDLVTQRTDGYQCYVQVASADGRERHDALCFSSAAESGDFTGRVVYDARINLSGNPVDPTVPYALEIDARNVKLSIRGSGAVIELRGRVGALTLWVQARGAQNGEFAGQVCSGSTTQSVVDGRARIRTQSGAASIVTAERSRLLIPELDLSLDVDLSSGFECVDTWTSGLTFEDYPTHLQIDGAEAILELRALRAACEAEFLHRASPRWIGWCAVKGRIGGARVDAMGLLTCVGKPLWPIDRFLERVSRATYRVIERVLPASAESLRVSTLFGAREYADLGISDFPADLALPVLQPITTILEREGQAWRGVLVALCCQAVGGEFDASSDWLLFTELIHTGALIVDDVQDETPTRRGGPACHALYGRATAINSGTLAYFIMQPVIESAEAVDGRRAAIYGEYFDLLRVAHLGQGIDHQLDVNLLSEESTDAEIRQLLDRVHYCDLFKSGMPFRCYARIGALLGGGTEEQVTALGRFFQTLGMSFQAVDDVVSLTGRRGGEDKRGDDLRRGKITRPVLLALASLRGNARARLCLDIKRAKGDIGAAVEVAEQICSMDVLSACREVALTTTASAYEQLKPVLADSIAMRLIKEFAVCTLQRHY